MLKKETNSSTPIDSEVPVEDSNGEIEEVGGSETGVCLGFKTKGCLGFALSSDDFSLKIPF